VREALSALSLIAICLPILFYDASTRVPGFAALPPALGAAAIIVAGETRAACVLLQNPFGVFIGRISYSLYLDHWPIVVF
jgi:peptidoglycan/LPS O-acetylase OafA/YrhL